MGPGIFFSSPNMLTWSFWTNSGLWLILIRSMYMYIFVCYVYILILGVTMHAHKHLYYGAVIGWFTLNVYIYQGEPHSISVFNTKYWNTENLFILKQHLVLNKIFTPRGNILYISVKPLDFLLIWKLSLKGVWGSLIKENNHCYNNRIVNLIYNYG